MKFKAEQGGISVNDFLRSKGFSRRLISQLKFEDRILVNSEAVWTNYVLRDGDEVETLFPEKLSENIIPQSLKLEILYEDDHILAVNKPAGMAIHPSHGHYSDTVANGIMGYYAEKGIKTPVRIAGRLDLDTTGVVLISKDALTSKILSETLIDKYYIAIACGRLPQKGRIEANISETEGEIKRKISSTGKTAITEYERLETRGDYSMARVKLLTGRTHQIRLHMAHLGYPLAGDSLYGDGRGMTRHALHAEKTEFTHPILNTKIVITSKLPQDMRDFWEQLKEEN